MNQTLSYKDLLCEITRWSAELGFQQLGVSDVDLDGEKTRFEAWLNANYQGSMAWLEEHKDLRLAPPKLVPGTTRVISLRMDYLWPETEQVRILKSPEKAYISRYALGRDYHKVVRKRLARLADKIQSYCQHHHISPTPEQRPFVDSAPVMERPLAAKAGLGWVGKHTLLIHPRAGSWFFLGELFTNLPLPVSEHQQPNQCGECQACLQICPTDAFPKPYVLDARRCISYLTIENKGPIAEEFREVMGNRVFGCDDCQIICPWNKFARFTREKDFAPRHNLDSAELVNLFLWPEQEYRDKTAGSPIRRSGYQNWLRNISVGLGNALPDVRIIDALQTRIANAKADCWPTWLIEHFEWALQRQLAPPKRRRRKLRRQRTP